MSTPNRAISPMIFRLFPMEFIRAKVGMVGGGVVKDARKRNCRLCPFDEARAFVRQVGAQRHVEWQTYARSGNRPDDIPAALKRTYKAGLERYNRLAGEAIKRIVINKSPSLRPINSSGN